MARDRADVVIIGCGVVGLTVAHELLAARPETRITLVARELPGTDDDSQSWSSPWASCNWFPYGNKPQTMRWETISYERLWDLIPTGLVMPMPTTMIWNNESIGDQIWYQEVVRDFRTLEPDELPATHKYGVKFTTITLEPRAYLQWMKSKLEERGCRFVRRHLPSIASASEYGIRDCVIVNATGMGAASLAGVEDTSMFPIRGQTITIHAPHITEGLSEVSSPEATYCIPRPGGTAILGGTFQFRNWETAADPDAGLAIFERCARLVPALRDKRTRIVSHNVALRPARMGGMRLETEIIEYPLDGLDEVLPDYGLTDDSEEKENNGRTTPVKTLKVVHAYGIGPAGFQNSFGIAADVVKLVLA